ncbi:hypothetical protein [Streptomyces sp. NPDC006368]|uniref:hypothetical protein n=1 Tax=Streptomyces sp. NPDC006368 TaxID=3156760 RepID=UPI0033B05761
MDDKRLEGPGESSGAVPRDLPDEQAGAGSDHWDADLAQAQAGEEQDEGGDTTPAGEPAPADSAETAGPEEDPAPDEPTS